MSNYPHCLRTDLGPETAQIKVVPGLASKTLSKSVVYNIMYNWIELWLKHPTLAGAKATNSLMHCPGLGSFYTGRGSTRVAGSNAQLSTS